MIVYWSRYYLNTLRENPKDAEAISHQLMVRAGLIRRLGSGAYSYLPFGLRALQKVTDIVREEMNHAGAQEVLLPVLQPAELWKTTGRYAVLGAVLMRLIDRTGKEMALGPTHEEVVTDLVKDIASHKQLPFTLYQIQTKFRDEPRPRFGVIRSKEFLMKDAYSFDADSESLAHSYQLMYEAYHRIFTRCGLKFRTCEADTGAMGGDVSHEFMAPSEYGEGMSIHCTQCGYAATDEAAACAVPQAPKQASDAQALAELQEVHTPGKHSVEAVSAFLGVAPSQLIKTLLYEAGEAQVAVLVRGDHAVNEAKLARLLKTTPIRLAGAESIQRLTGAPVGFSGPVNLNGVRLVADHAVLSMVRAVTGANAKDKHLINVHPGRDFKPEAVTDLRIATPGDVCPRCGSVLKFERAIEVGHVFKLGTKYTEALGMSFQNAQGKQMPALMGCYGIGINRLLATVIEQSHDEKGIVWPAAIAPFPVLVSCMGLKEAALRKLAEQICQDLDQAGWDVLYDDRDLSPGIKFKDADLIGLPAQVVVGKAWLQEQKLELRLRCRDQKQLIQPAELVVALHNLLDTGV